MPRNHSFNARAGKGRGVSPVNHWSDDDESDVEAAAVGKAEEGEINLVPGDEQALEHAITVRIPIGAMASSDVQAILKRAKKPSGNAKAVAQVVLDVAVFRSPSRERTRSGPTRCGPPTSCWCSSSRRRRRRSVRPPALSTPPSAPSRCVTLTPPTYPPTPIARPRGPSLAGQNGQGQEGEGPRQAAQTGEFERQPPVQRADEGTCVCVGVGVCVCLSQCT